MLNWIEKWFRAGVGLISTTALDWIHVALHGIAGIIHTVFGDVNKAWLAIQHAFWFVFGEVAYTARLVFTFLYWVVHIAIPAVVKYAFTVGKLLWHEVGVIFKWAAREILKFYLLARRYTLDLWHWAYTHIVHPIEVSLTAAWQWITKRGETLWYYLTHPDKLIDLLLPFLAGGISRASNNTLSAIGIVVTALVLHNIRRVLVILEDIIAAVL